MIHKLNIGIGAGLAFLTLASSSMAATVEPIQGSLSVNQGKGFVQIAGPTKVNVGDAVMVSPDGSAVVVYPDGCKVAVHPGAVMRIEPISPCAVGSHAQGLHNDDAWVIGGVTAGLLGFGIYEIESHGGASPSAPKPASP